MPTVTHTPDALKNGVQEDFIKLTSALQGAVDEKNFSGREIDRLAIAHDASHYLLVPGGIVRPENAQDIGKIFAAAREHQIPLAFRSGGTSLSGQSSSDGILLDTRKHFKKIEVLDSGRRVRVEPGATVMMVNNHLAPYGYKLGPDPASWSACTIGGVVANNSSGMSSGTEFNTYNTLDSMVFVLPSGTVIDTADHDADAQLREQEPEIHEGLIRLRKRVVENPASVDKIRQQFSMKNTMGYGINAFLDFEKPVDILEHLLIGSEGTLGFIASATYRTLPILPAVTTGLLVFKNLIDASESIPDLIAHGTATAELLDATSIRVAQRTGLVADALAQINVENHAAVLVEFQGQTQGEIDELSHRAEPLWKSLDLASPVTMSSNPAERNKLWAARRGLYTTVAGNRPSGTNALLEDVVVPVQQLGETCRNLSELFDQHGYRDSVIFGHAKDGNIHFMLNEQFNDAAQLSRYQAFTEDMVELILGNAGSLKAEHGTGRIMAPFVRQQYGDELYEIMVAIKRLIDPTGLLNPGVLINEDKQSLVQNLKVAEEVEDTVDRCVECGYCEPACPSKDLTLTPRQRIVIRREMKNAEAAGDTELLNRLQHDYRYSGIETCAVDGMCLTRCPVHINTGDLIRDLRAKDQNPVAARGWKVAAQGWGALAPAASQALNLAHLMPSLLPRTATQIARKVLDEDTVPQYNAQLPAGGRRRQPRANPLAEIVFFPACVNAMFGGVDHRGKADETNASQAFELLCERAGIEFNIPTGIEAMCCGTPWKSKGFTSGYQVMSDRVLQNLWLATRGGRLPVVCDATSCTEGLETMKAKVRAAAEYQTGRSLDADEPDFSRIEFIDAVAFTAEQILPRLEVKHKLDSLVLHPTCSMTHLGIQPQFEMIAQALSEDAVVPLNWGCCAYAGDRGMLHPELTASATRAETAEVNAREYAAYASSNRTCEQGMTEATGHTYQNILQLLERATR